MSVFEISHYSAVKAVVIDEQKSLGVRVEAEDQAQRVQQEEQRRRDEAARRDAAQLEAKRAADEEVRRVREQEEQRKRNAEAAQRETQRATEEQARRLREQVEQRERDEAAQREAQRRTAEEQARRVREQREREEVAAVARRVEVSDANTARYTAHFMDLKQTWKETAGGLEGGVEGFFFDTTSAEKASAELQYPALLALKYRFLCEHPDINIPDLENFGVFTIGTYDTTTHAATIRTAEMVQNLLNPALKAFEQGANLYASIVQIGGANSGHYTLAGIEKSGRVHLINTIGLIARGLESEDPYRYIMPNLVEALNANKGASSITFTAGTNVRTGIQDADAGSNSCGLYSFTYWAALMLTQDMNAYKRITAAAEDGRLRTYDDIASVAVSAGQGVDVVRQVTLVSSQGFQHQRNPKADVQARFELSLRQWLMNELPKYAQ